MSTQRRRSFVTGGGAGIGAAISRATTARGDRLVITDVDQTSGGGLAEELGQLFVRLDVSDRKAWDTTEGRLAEEFDALDSVYLNAGVGTGGHPVRLDGLEWPEYDRVMRVNCDGVVAGLRMTLPFLTAGTDPVVTVTSSVRGIYPGPGDPFYSMSKHALVGLVRSLAPQLLECGIRINAVCPGATIAPDTMHLMKRAPWNAQPWQPAKAVADAMLEVEREGTTGGVFTVVDSTLSEVDLIPERRWDQAKG